MHRDQFDVGGATTSHGSNISGASTSTYVPPSSGIIFSPPKHYTQFHKKPNIKLTQERLNDVIRDMDLPKGKSELLASRLKDLGISDGKFLVFSSPSRFFFVSSTYLYISGIVCVKVESVCLVLFFL